MPDPKQVESMFDRIARRYDFMNRVMTMGIDRRWRTAAVNAAGLRPEDAALDVCCGTGDLTFEIARRGVSRVVGLDFSANMLEQARHRRDEEPAGRASTVEFVRGDATSLPFSDATFDAVTVGFGIRNVDGIPAAFGEFARVLKPGGRAICLEITQPKHPAARAFYGLWFDRLVPRLGGMLAGDSQAYSYLPESVRGFPPADELADIMRNAGLDSVSWKTFAGGIVALHVGTRPLQSGTSPEHVGAAADAARS